MNLRPRSVLVLVLAPALAAGTCAVTLRHDRDTAARRAPANAAPTTPPTTATTAPTTTTATAGTEEAGPARCGGILVREALGAAPVPPGRTHLTLESVASGVEAVRGLRFSRLPVPRYL
ncbi:MAG: hypothetical protein C4344_03340, partial [Acidimicrobiia bacterium]